MSPPSDDRLEPYKPLSPQQELVAGCIAEGMEAWEVAAELNIAETTVRYHVREIANKLPGTLPPIRRIRRWYYAVYLKHATDEQHGAA